MIASQAGSEREHKRAGLPFFRKQLANANGGRSFLSKNTIIRNESFNPSWSVMNSIVFERCN